ncbi:MAG: cupin domain-containing protein [Gemmatimonadales bacterium]
MTNDDRNDAIVPRRIVELVAYQEGAVVSRTVLKGETGSVTVFAFDAGQSLSEHTVPHDALVHVIDGKAGITIADQPFTLEAGEMLVMPANRPHTVCAPERFKMALTMIRK